MTQLPPPAISPTPLTSSTTSTTPVDILILGAGWTSTFLIPHLLTHSIPFAATTRTGTPRSSHPTIPFTFDPSPTAPTTPYTSLPPTKTLLITFPLPSAAAASLLLSHYASTHPTTPTPHLIIFSSVGIYPGPANRHTLPNPEHPRVPAEEVVLQHGGAVLALAGLWGARRDPRNWLPRVAPDKEALRGKGTLHLVHGWDVARAVVGVQRGFCEGWAVAGRWVVTDARVYDWWELALGWGRGGWVLELMKEEGVGSLPRREGRRVEAREFWEMVGGCPEWGLARRGEEGAI